MLGGFFFLFFGSLDDPELDGFFLVGGRLLVDLSSPGLLLDDEDDLRGPVEPLRLRDRVLAPLRLDRELAPLLLVRDVAELLLVRDEATLPPSPPPALDVDGRLPFVGRLGFPLLLLEDGFDFPDDGFLGGLPVGGSLDFPFLSGVALDPKSGTPRFGEKSTGLPPFVMDSSSEEESSESLESESFFGVTAVAAGGLKAFPSSLEESSLSESESGLGREDAGGATGFFGGSGSESLESLSESESLAAGLAGGTGFLTGTSSSLESSLSESESTTFRGGGAAAGFLGGLGSESLESLSESESI